VWCGYLTGGRPGRRNLFRPPTCGAGSPSRTDGGTGPVPLFRFRLSAVRGGRRVACATFGDLRLTSRNPRFTLVTDVSGTP
jgi:hypothetical protein